MSFKSKISYWLFNKKNFKNVNGKFIAWNNIEQMSIILFSSQYKELNEFIKIAKADSIPIYLYIIDLNNSGINFDIEQKHVIITKKQFNFFGFLKPSFKHLDNHLKNSVLINLGSDVQIHSMIVSEFITANCKIAYFNHSLFDICITKETELTNTEFLKQVIVYLKMIKTEKTML